MKAHKHHFDKNALFYASLSKAYHSDPLYCLKLYLSVEHKEMFCFQPEMYCFCLCCGSQTGFEINNLKLLMSWDLQNFQNNDLSIIVSIISQYFDVYDTAIQ